MGMGMGTVYLTYLEWVYIILVCIFHNIAWWLALIHEIESLLFLKDILPWHPFHG